jgi:thiamine pyrophosphate-dependent acetolactate synthase large subunit-like protein
MTKKPVTVQPFTVADYLLTRLKQLNVTEVFQIPGDYVKHFTQALEHFPGVNAIGAVNELDAAYAADAYGRTRGLGAVSLQYGVSTFSALNAIAGAYVEFSPVVVVSATPGADARQITKMYDVLYHHSTGNLRADQEVFRQVTVAAETLSTSVGAGEKIDNLLIAAITYKRPVYIECYKEVWGEPCPKPSGKVLQPLTFRSEPLALENAVAMAWAQITAAKNPMIFAGVEVLRHGLSGLLQQIIDASGFLYTTTTLGKTVRPRSEIRLLPDAGHHHHRRLFVVHRKQIRRHGAGHHGAGSDRIFHLSRRHHEGFHGSLAAPFQDDQRLSACSGRAAATRLSGAVGLQFGCTLERQARNHHLQPLLPALDEVPA